MRKLSKYEKETIINWNEAENLASVYTFNVSLKRRLAEFSRKYPLLCRLERSTPEGSVTYVLDKSRLSIRLIPPYSEERKAAASALLGSRGKAHWQVKGGSHYRVKGEAPCPGKVDACVNLYWVLPDADFRRICGFAALPRPRNIFAGRRKIV